MSDATARSASHAPRWRALALLLLLVFATTWSRPAGREQADFWTVRGRALELVTPDVFARIEPSDLIELNMTRPALLGLSAGGWESHPDAVGRVDTLPEPDAPQRVALPARAADVPLPPHGAAYVGLLPLLLALLGVLATGSALAWLARLAVLLGVGWLLMAGSTYVGPGTYHGPLWPFAADVVLPGVQVLFVLAGACGLAWLDGLGDEHRHASAPIVVGSLSVLVCGVLMVLAARIGTAEPTQAVAALAERLLSLGAPEPTRPAMLATAEHLTRCLEEAALVSFAAMTALLLHFKNRGPVTALVLLAVALLDVARPLTGRWMDLLGALFGG